MRQFKEETRRLSSAKSRVDDAEMAQKTPKLRIREFLRHTLREGDDMRRYLMPLMLVAALLLGGCAAGLNGAQGLECVSKIP